MNTRSPKFTRKQGFTLVEVVISLAIFSICILPMLALLLVGMNTSQTSSFKTVAGDLSGAIVADLHATSATATATTAAYATPRFGMDLTPAGLPVTSHAWFDVSGNFLGTAAVQPAGAEFRATIYVKAAATASNLTALVVITWPATIAPVMPPPFLVPLAPSSSYYVVTNFQSP